MTPEEELEAIKARLDNREKMADLVYKYFYGMTLGGAKYRLAKIMKNYTLGLPLLSDSEILHEFIVSYGKLAFDDEEAIKELRGEFWKQKNRASDNTELFEAFPIWCATKQLTVTDQTIFEFRSDGME